MSNPQILLTNPVSSHSNSTWHMWWCLYLRTLSNSALSRPASMDSRCSLWVTCSKRATFSFASTSSFFIVRSFSFLLHSLAAASWFLRALISSSKFTKNKFIWNPESRMQNGNTSHTRDLVIFCRTYCNILPAQLYGLGPVLEELSVVLLPFLFLSWFVPAQLHTLLLVPKVHQKHLGLMWLFNFGGEANSSCWCC